MSDVTPASDREPGSGHVTLRYWASARAAAGIDTDAVAVNGPVSLAQLLERARAAHADSSRFSDVLSCCSVMVGDRPFDDIGGGKAVGMRTVLIGGPSARGQVPAHDVEPDAVVERLGDVLACIDAWSPSP